MKKILITISLLLILSSCWSNNLSDSGSLNNDSLSSNESSQNIEPENNIITIKEVKEKFSKLESELTNDKNLLVDFDMYLSSMLEQTINKKALKKLDIKICSELWKDYLIDNCKNSIILEKWKQAKNSEICTESYTNTWEIVNCSNSLNNLLARDNKDIKFCDLIKTEDGFLENECKNSVYSEQAREKLDITICNKISDVWFKEMCTMDIKMLKEMKAAESQNINTNN